MKENLPVLFTPGPVRIPAFVAQYLSDPPCNYHRQEEFRAMFAETESDLKELIGIRDADAYFATIITSTGTGANEATMLAMEGLGKGLILNNGFFAARAVDQAVQNHIDHITLESAQDRPLDPAQVDATLAANPDVKWVFYVSHETRTGLVNPMVELGKVCKQHGVMIGADIISSSYAYPVDIEAAQVDLAVSSSAKAILAAAGLGIVFTRKVAAATLKPLPTRGYYLDVIAEYEKQREEMQPRFAQPVPLHAALRAACIHLKKVGIANHMARIQSQMDELATDLAERGCPMMLEAEYRSGVAVNFRLPEGMPYHDFALRMQAEGYYLLYGIPGDDSHFQLSTIGDLSQHHIDGLKAAFGRVLP